MTNPKTLEHAHEIQSTISDLTYDEISKDVEASISRQITSASNEVCAQLAWDAFYDGCEAYDVPATIESFARNFPVYAELV